MILPYLLLFGLNLLIEELAAILGGFSHWFFSSTFSSSMS